MLLQFSSPIPTVNGLNVLTKTSPLEFKHDVHVVNLNPPQKLENLLIFSNFSVNENDEEESKETKNLRSNLLINLQKTFETIDNENAVEFPSARNNDQLRRRLFADDNFRIDENR